MIPSYSIVVAVDPRTVDQLKLTWPTWRRKPGILDVPMHVIVDAGLLPRDASYQGILALDHPNVTYHNWNFPWLVFPDMTQRERMLSAFVYFAPLLVDTDYWLKLDVDSVATDDKPWVDEAWFARNPVLVARPWSYTKPGEWIDTLQAWSRSNLLTKHYPPLDWPPHDETRQVYRHSRIISQQCFVQTEWSRRVAAYLQPRLPVPSQDTIHWYLAELQRLPIVKARFPGWTNRCTRRGLEEAVAGAIAEMLR
ncbi:MAG: hypothetical protein ABFD92_21445 [Planctomycetaceae bacterium]